MTGKMKSKPFRDPFRFGHVEGFPVGSTWESRKALCYDGVHAGLSRGINGREAEGAFSVVLSGGYEDDVDSGQTITYTGEGGQKKGVIGQVENQVWKKGNRAMQISHLNGRPVRVIRGSRLKSPYAPLIGYRYDGLYSVQTAETVRGKHGFSVCQFKLVRRPKQPPLPPPHPKPKKTIPRPAQVQSDEGSSSNHPIIIDFTPENSQDECDQISDFEPF